jgi:hypothetical protein
VASSLESIVTEFIVAMNDPALTSTNVLIGRRHLYGNRSAPKIVFVREGGAIVPPDRVGAAKVSTTIRSRIIGLRQHRVHVFCFGLSDEMTETMITQSFRALRNLSHASFTDVSESWVSQEDGADGFAKQGELASLVFTWTIPVYDVSRPLRSLTGSPKFLENESFAGEQVPCAESE